MVPAGKRGEHGWLNSSLALPLLGCQAKGAGEIEQLTLRGARGDGEGRDRYW